jgi:hypothetical protein
MKNKRISMRILAGVMAAFMVFSVVAGALAIFLA